MGGVRLTHCGVGGGGESRLPISSAVAVAYFHRRRRQVLKSRPATRPDDLTIVEPSPVFFPSSGFFSFFYADPLSQPLTYPVWDPVRRNSESPPHVYRRRRRCSQTSFVDVFSSFLCTSVGSLTSCRIRCFHGKK